MKLDENYSIEKDPYCWILRYEKTGEINEKTGKPIQTLNETYHNSTKQALAEYLDCIIGDNFEVIGILESIKLAESNILNMKA